MKINEMFSKGLQLKVQAPKVAEALKAVDPESIHLQGLANIEWPRPHHLIFAKSDKVLQKLGRLLPKELQSSLSEIIKTCILIGDEKFISKLDAAVRQSLEAQFAAVYTINDTMMGIVECSRHFYQAKWDQLNNLTDGRILGTTDIHPTVEIAQGVFIGDSVKIAAGVKIYPGCVVMGQASIGQNSQLFPNVTLYPYTQVGRDVRLHSGTVIGADGFGYHYHQGVHHKIWHMGGVEIGDQVEIGANSCVDAGTFSPTVIGAGSKLDNHVQVGHNCQLGRGVVLCGHVAIGGSSHIDDFCVFGGKSGMGSDMHLGQGCQVAGGALVNSDWPAQTTLGGHPARPLKEWMRGIAYLRQMSLKK